MDPFEMENEARRYRALTTILTDAGNLLDLKDRAPAVADDLDAIVTRITEAAIDAARDPAELRRDAAALLRALGMD